MSAYQKAKARLDDIFSRYIRARDILRYRGVCPLCRARPIEVCFHFFPRGFLYTRWHLDAACGACSWCNGEEQATRDTPAGEKFRILHCAIAGSVSRMDLEAHYRDSVKFSAAELVEQYDIIKRLHDELKDTQK